MLRDRIRTCGYMRYIGSVANSSKKTYFITVLSGLLDVKYL